MSHQSEKQLENLLINKLKKFGYEYVRINNEKDLWRNFKIQIERFNNIKLTEKEFERLKNHMSGNTIYKASQKLHDKFVLERKDEIIYIDLLDEENHLTNIFQVTNQIQMEGKYTNIYDVTLLINGIPILQLELKRSGVQLKKAFNQIHRYKRNSYHNLFNFIQLFVISNKMNTKYFANNNLFQQEVNDNFTNTFYWATETNERITNLDEFSNEFLDPYKLHKFITKYIIREETSNKLMALRPYQIYAIEAIKKRAIETKNNGYVWHTTGSGKTLTSWITAKQLRKNKHIDRVFFLIDRRDLDLQTVEEFNKFSEDAIDTTKSTKSLIRQINSGNRLIVTTIQKLNYAIKNNRYSKTIQRISSDKTIFLIDECHRSQFGDMHNRIKKEFTNAQYFGFTGTPRFEENKSQDGRTTADIFEKCLHTYTIKEAIRDNNVLAFLVEYFKTFDIDNIKQQEKNISGINEREILEDDKRLKNIAQKTIDIHHSKTHQKKYSAIFTVTSIEVLVKYYKIFKEMDHDLKISGIFTFEANEDLENKKYHSRVELERIIEDYNEMFGTSYSTDESEAYQADVSNRVKNGELDILLVVRMFLTGFDSKKLNTLYVDKHMYLHDLLQGFSRTNRIYEEDKSHGNIVCYRSLKQQTDEAILLFSKSDNTDVVLLKSFNHYLEQFNTHSERLFKIAPTPAAVDKLEVEEDHYKFINEFNALSKVLATMRTFIEFEFNADALNISEQTYNDYKSKYLDLYEQYKRQNSGLKESVVDEVDFEMSLIQKDEINVTYILNLIRQINLKDKGKQRKDIKRILKVLSEATDEKLRKKRELIEEFLEKEVPKFNKDSNTQEKFEEYMQESREKKIDDLSEEFSITRDILVKTIEKYEFSNVFEQGAVERIIRREIMPGAKHRFRALREVKNKIGKLREKIDDIILMYN